MLAGNLTQSDVMSFDSYVTVNGTVRPHLTWDTGRELIGDMPSQVVAAGGTKQATGSIAWAKDEAVSDRALNPWNAGGGWVPRTGDRVEIWGSDGMTTWRLFKGVIDETSGSLAGGATSTIVDESDRLNVRFAHDALLRVMPPTDNGGLRRGVGLSFTYFLDAAFRAAGFNITPPLEARPAISVPAQGSMWPERGNVIAASAQVASVSSHAVFQSTPWGYAASNFEATLGPIVRLAPSEPVEFTFMVAPGHAGNASMTAFYGSASIQLAAAGSRTVIARLNGVEKCRVVMGDATTVSLLVKNGVWTLRTDRGDTATGTGAPTGTAIMDRVTLSGDEASQLAGFQVCYPSATTEFRPVQYVQTATIETASGFVSLMDASPVIPSTTSKELIDEISRATLTGIWIDEQGILRAVPSNLLRTRTASQTITTLDDIRELSWSDSLLSVRSSVDVDFRRPYIDLGIYQNRLLHQGSAVTLSTGERAVTLISPPSDEDWIGVDLDVEVLGDVGASSNSNIGRGSITGAVLADGTTESPGNAYLTATLTQVSPGTLKITHTAGSLPAGKELEIRYPSASTTIWPRWLKESFPIIRGFARNAWRDETRTSTIKGPSYAPVLVHDAGPWASREDNTIVIDRQADFLAGQVTKPAATISGMRVGFDPRRQLGDVVELSSESFLGVSLTCLITGVRNKANGSFLEQTLDVTIISARSTFTTFGQFEDAHPDTLTYEQWRMLFPDTATYQTFNNEPLRGAP